MKVLHTSLYFVDHNKDIVDKIPVEEKSDHLQKYITGLLEEIIASGNERKFLFVSETTQVYTSCQSFLKSDYINAAEINAKRLLSKEKVAQKAIEHLNKKIQTGSLIQSLVEIDENEKIIVLSKCDYNTFLEKGNFDISNGLPLDKKLFKAILVKFNGVEVSDVYVYDTTGRIAKYWWHDFLELQEKYTDTYNTDKVLDMLERKVFNSMKKKFPADREILRNSTLGYIRNREEFDITEYVSEVFKNYKPENSEFETKAAIETILKLPEKFNFDKRFSVDPKAIKKRMTGKVVLGEGMTLILNKELKNFRSTIQTEKDSEGNKLLIIKTDQGYDHFSNGK